MISCKQCGLSSVLLSTALQGSVQITAQYKSRVPDLEPEAEWVEEILGGVFLHLPLLPQGDGLVRPRNLLYQFIHLLHNKHKTHHQNNSLMNNTMKCYA